MLNASTHQDVAYPHHFPDVFQADTSSAIAELSQHPILEAVVAETHSAGLLTAAVLSGVNALTGRLAARGAENLRTFIPEDPAILLALWPQPDDAGMRIETADKVDTYFAELEPARVAIRQFFVDQEQLGCDRAATLHYFPLLGPWRRVAASAIEAIEHLDADSKERLPFLYSQSAAILVRILKHAISGGMPCLTDDGRPFLPILPQRRGSARRMLGQTCKIYHRGRVSEAFARDVSRGGFGLRGVMFALPDGIEIELPDGRRFDATVMWQRGESAGVRLSKPLRPNDPLLWG